MDQSVQPSPAAPQHLLKTFYERFFPFKQYVRWLAYGETHSDSVFARREFSFTLDNDVYVRFQSFNKEDELRSELCNRVPVKLDIGAVYSVKPGHRKSYLKAAFTPSQKELVFDIDMTDYDDVRTCCQGAQICTICWNFMKSAVKVLDECLRQDFGYSHLLWIYSGRRGVHCWVCDASARLLSNAERCAIVRYLDLQRSKVPPVLPPSLARAHQTVLPYFTQAIVHDMNLFDNETLVHTLLAMISDAKSKDKVKTLLDSLNSASSSALEKWHLFESFMSSSNLTGVKPNFTRDLVLHFAYPRLDEKVSTNINHLLKSPFCVHPSTGRVCVPMDPANIDDFDPFSVPTISDLNDQLNCAMSIDGPDWKKTSLKEYIEFFEKFVKSLEQDARMQIRKQNQGSTDF